MSLPRCILDPSFFLLLDCHWVRHQHPGNCRTLCSIILTVVTLSQFLIPKHCKYKDVFRTFGRIFRPFTCSFFAVSVSMLFESLVLLHYLFIRLVHLKPIFIVIILTQLRLVLQKPHSINFDVSAAELSSVCLSFFLTCASHFQQLHESNCSDKIVWV